MKRLIGSILIGLLVVGCSSEDQEVSINGNDIRFECVRKKGEVEEKLFSFDLNGIECVDWENRSFKLEQGYIDSLEMYRGTLYECYKVIYKDTTVSYVNLYNPLSSNVTYIPNSPSVLSYFPIISEGWIVFNLHEDPAILDGVFTSELYAYFSDKDVLKGKSWECTEGENRKKHVNDNFPRDLKIRFSLKY